MKKNKRDKFKTAEKGDRILLSNIPNGTKYVYKNYDKTINDSIDVAFKNSGKKQEIAFEFTGKLGEKPKLTGEVINSLGKKITVTFEGDSLIEEASKRGADKENIKTKLSETGETTFAVQQCDVYIDNNIFLPMSVLKQLRRDVLDSLKEKLVASYERKSENNEMFRIEIEEDRPKHAEISVMVSNKKQKEIVEKLGIKKIDRKSVV